jgi:hypothetical protein
VGDPIVMPGTGEAAANDRALVERTRDEVAEKLERLIDEADAKRAKALGGPLDIAVAAVRDLADSRRRTAR